MRVLCMDDQSQATLKMDAITLEGVGIVMKGDERFQPVPIMASEAWILSAGNITSSPSSTWSTHIPSCSKSANLRNRPSRPPAIWRKGMTRRRHGSAPGRLLTPGNCHDLLSRRCLHNFPCMESPVEAPVLRGDTGSQDLPTKSACMKLWLCSRGLMSVPCVPLGQTGVAAVPLVPCMNRLPGSPTMLSVFCRARIWVHFAA